MTKNPIKRQALEEVKEATKRGQNLEYKQFKEKTFHERWLTDKYGGQKMADVAQIGGQAVGGGPDILKYIKQHDPQNSAGGVKDALDIMTKLQDATAEDDLYSSIQPLENILGGDLYSAMKGGGAKSKAQAKTQKKGCTSIICRIIDAAMICTEKKNPDARDKAGELLNNYEIDQITEAYNKNEKYRSSRMPSEFVSCINEIIPQFRRAEGLIA